LCVFGSVGVGKTWLAAAAAWEMVDRRPVRWVSVPVLLAQLMASFADAERAAALRAITGTGPLILDDLDKGNATDWTRQQLFAAIDGRVTAGAPLLITTNLPPSAIGERLGDPIMSRVVGYCQVVEIAGADRRLEAARRRAA
jgi:DNA replication protein DnaC